MTADRNAPRRERITLYNRWRRWRGKSYSTYGHEPMPARFNELAWYNTERRNGIVHTDEKQARMAVLQQDFDLWVGRRG